MLSNHSFLSCVNVSQCLFSFSTTSLQQRDTQPSPVQGETITGTQVKMTGQQEVLLCVSSSFPPPHSGKRARFCLPQSPALRPVSAAMVRHLVRQGLMTWSRRTHQRAHCGLGTLSGEPASATFLWMSSRSLFVYRPQLPSRVTYIHGPRESACQPSPWRGAEVTREATERCANISKMLRDDRDHFPFSKWVGKKKKQQPIQSL